MSALGQKRTCAVQNGMSALPPPKRHQMRHNGMSAVGQKRTGSRVYAHFFLLRDFFFVWAFLFVAARFLAATLLATFFLAEAVVVAPLPASALAPLAALACIDVATVPKTALAAAVEAAFAVAAALATSPASTFVLSSALFPAVKTASRALVMVPLLFIFDLGRQTWFMDRYFSAPQAAEIDCTGRIQPSLPRSCHVQNGR